MVATLAGGRSRSHRHRSGYLCKTCEETLTARLASLEVYSAVSFGYSFAKGQNPRFSTQAVLVTCF